ncbi:hypothetical protein V493_08593 [Pseudogymnoascus sp. VKM F-4281 (FW-2241)]|nr:hypothetical protein V493_08593 [Pseudogymnoascus sp. VKM F-4281 (FW-2241)]
MVRTNLLAVLLLPAALAAPSTEKRVGPEVRLRMGNVVGSSFLSVDSFMGIPFAKPPVGALRLKPPQSITSNLGTIVATGTPRACPQGTASRVDTTKLGTNATGVLGSLPVTPAALESDSPEDCLTLNVQRPSSATSSSKLPVLFWIFGGGFTTGSTQIYDGTSLISTSVSQKSDIIFVAVNYRLGAFGFLSGKQVLADGSTNLGIRDQRLALQWVADNIASFGGDPSKVTIWGESAGSASVFSHMIYKNGNHTYKGKPLFRGAIMDSGSLLPAAAVNESRTEDRYNIIVQNAGCSGASDTLSCLRNLDYATFLNVSSNANIPINTYLPRRDGIIFSDTPENLLKSGKYAPVPFICGTQEDEGTLFTYSLNLQNSTDVVDHLAYTFPDTTRAILQGFVDTYPDDVSSGSPFRTGPFNNIYPQYKTIAAITGDYMFVFTRRLLLTLAATAKPNIPTWSYIGTYFYGLPVLGTFHATDLLPAFGITPGNAAFSIQSYYISFVHSLDPNSGTPSILQKWPLWSAPTNKLLNFGAFKNTVTGDNFRQTSFDFWRANFSKFVL